MAMLLMTGLAACQLIGGFDDYGPAPSSSVGGGVGGSGGDNTNVCALAGPPERSTEPGGTGDQSFVLAVRSFDFGEDELTGDFGFDRDGACTCSTALAGCPCATSVAGCQLQDHDTNDCDDEGGIDASSRRIVRFLAGNDPSLASPPLTAAAEDGDWTLLFRVRGYNGEANDDAVSLAVLSAGGPVQASPCNPDSRAEARWDGQDHWPINAGTLFPGARLADCGLVVVPISVDMNAYVVDNHLVARLGALLLKPPWGVEIRIDDVIVDLPLVADGNTWRVKDGVLSGQWSLEDLLRAVAQSAERRSQPLCGVTAAEELAMGLICPYLDLNESAEDNRCDAASYVLMVDAEAAQLGEAVEVPTIPLACDSFIERTCL